MEQKPKIENQQIQAGDETQNPGESSQNQDNFWLKPISRRDALKKGVVLVGGSVGAVAAGKYIADTLVPPKNPDSGLSEPQSNQIPESTKSPEILNSGTEYGFNTHVHVNPGEGDSMTLDAFKGDVDALVGANQSWIRFNLINSGALSQNPDGSINFSEGIGVFDEAIKYAKKRGLKIAFVTNVPDSNASLPINEYIDQAAAFYAQIAERYGDYIDTWQIFNEPDTHHFRDYTELKFFDEEGKYKGFEPGYLDDLAKVVAASASAIKAVIPDSKITMNASLWGPDRNKVLDRTERFIDAVYKYLDFISLNPYPDIYNPSSAQTIPQDVEHFYNRYGKDIVIAEIGVSSLDIQDPERRSKILLDQLSAIKGGKIKPKSILFYEMRDEPAAQEPREREFGTEDIMDALTQQMQPENPAEANQP